VADVVSVRELVLKSFTKHKSTQLKFPDHGVVLVTGSNGGGKSSIVEGVSYAGWGETLRGTMPGDDCTAGLTTQDLLISRARGKSKTALSWREGLHEAEEFPTTTKAQTALESHIGPWEVWRRTHVFSSTDAAHFTMATDKERKLFLETLLGLGRFDEALQKCRTACQGVDGLVNAAQAAIQLNVSKRGALVQRKADAERVLTDLGPSATPAETTEAAEALEKKRAHLKEHIRKGEREYADLNRQIAEASGDTGGAEREMHLLAKRLLKLGETGTCDSCGQAVPQTLRKGIEDGIDDIKRRVTADKVKAAASSAEFLAEAKDVVGVLKALRERESAIVGELEGLKRAALAHVAADRARVNAQAQLVVADKERAIAEQKLTEAEDAYRTATHEQAVLEACEVVLGLKGVRSGILAKLLGGLEAAANVWLQRVAGKGMRLELKSYSEKKTGGVSDAISLQVHGAGGGLGYKSCSGGERRRIDIALLLAFAGKGSIFLDECLDALDSEGIEAVIGVCEELAAERCVVLITHNEELAARVPHVAHWRVEDGIVSA
jgi:DNA repair exonuclease SbcCD ATPase subunit